ncbi:Hypothetical_protein [Hexamita inflata]|uniref:Hypothetical_protein n=1 Tax=Hexamita inflata TaxID=28002 RepID=A0ABP1HZY7_9EUKA
MCPSLCVFENCLLDSFLFSVAYFIKHFISSDHRELEGILNFLFVFKPELRPNVVCALYHQMKALLRSVKRIDDSRLIIRSAFRVLHGMLDPDAVAMAGQQSVLELCTVLCENISVLKRGILTSSILSDLLWQGAVSSTQLKNAVENTEMDGHFLTFAYEFVYHREQDGIFGERCYAFLGRVVTTQFTTPNLKLMAACVIYRLMQHGVQFEPEAVQATGEVLKNQVFEE